MQKGDTCKAKIANGTIVERGNFSHSSDGRTFGCVPKRLLKFSIPYGGLERPDKLLNSFKHWQVGRPSKIFNSKSHA